MATTKNIMDQLQLDATKNLIDSTIANLETPTNANSKEDIIAQANKAIESLEFLASTAEQKSLLLIALLKRQYFSSYDEEKILYKAAIEKIFAYNIDLEIVAAGKDTILYWLLANKDLNHLLASYLHRIDARAQPLLETIPFDNTLNDAIYLENFEAFQTLWPYCRVREYLEKWFAQETTLHLKAIDTALQRNLLDLETINDYLFKVAGQGFSAFVSLLLEHGASVNYKEDFFGDGQTPLMQAAANNRLVCMELLLNHGADIEPVDEYGKTALIYATAYNNVSCVELLLNRGANIEHACKLGRTPLIYAIGDNGNCMQLLLNRGANIEHVTSSGETALMYAALLHTLEAAQLLLNNKAQVNANGAKSPLMQAIRRDNIQMARLLLSYGADVAYIDAASNTALLEAARTRSLATMQFLLDYSKQRNLNVQINHSTNDGDTALIVVAKSNWIEGAQLLLDYGADINAHLPNRDTALMLVARKHNVDFVRFLLEKGADPSIIIDNSNALQSTVAHAFYGIRWNQNIITIMTLLLEQNRYLDNIPDYPNSSSALIRTSFCGQAELLRVLLKYNNSSDYINNTTCQGENALMWATRGGHSDCVALLLEHGASLGAVNHLGQNALSLAEPNSPCFILLEQAMRIENKRKTDAIDADEAVKSSRPRLR